MRITQRDNRQHITLDPGEYYVSDQNVIISTILGSCVSACLYDPICGVVGMNHFLITYRGNADKVLVCETEPGKYGICAMETLIDGMLKRGARREHLHAKVFGGGSMFKSFDECSLNEFCVGSNNCVFIMEFLKDSRIRLAAHDLGGDSGRLIHFYYNSFTVYVRRLKKTLNSKVTQKDRRLWDNTLKARGLFTEAA